ncbi:type II secretion system F family protein [bacterium]|nr:type II secretion system F family protein [bacterium]
MLYQYKAYNQEGKIVKGKAKAESLSVLLNDLSEKGLTLITVEKKKGFLTSLFKKEIFSKKITLKDQIFLTKYLYLMLEVGADLLKAVEIFKEDASSKAVKDFLTEIEINLKKGQPLWQTFAKHPKIFSNVTIGMIKAGENSGNLSQTFKILSISLEKQERIRKNIKSALIYPVLLIVASILVIGLTVFVTIPKVAKVFLSTGVKPPLFSRIIINFSLFLSKYGLPISLFFIFLIALFWITYKYTKKGRRVFNQSFYKVPIVKTILQKIDIQRFSFTWASLLNAGLSVTESLRLSAETINNLKTKEAVLRVIDQGLNKGKTLGESFKKEKENFPQVLVSLIGIAEQAGHLSATLDTLADFYTSEVDSTVKSLTSILEPVILIFIGIIVAIIALAVIVPIYQMTTTITG